MKNKKSLLTIVAFAMLSACGSTKNSGGKVDGSIAKPGEAKENFENFLNLSLPKMSEKNLAELQEQKKNKLSDAEKTEYEKLIDFANHKDEYEWKRVAGEVGIKAFEAGDTNWVYEFENKKMSFDDVNLEAKDKGLQGYLLGKKDDKVKDKIDFATYGYQNIFTGINEQQAKDRAAILNKWIAGGVLTPMERSVVDKLPAMTADFASLNNDTQSKIKLLAKHLSRGKIETEMKYEFKKSDVLKTGANALTGGGLAFSNFGVWEELSDFSSLDPDLKKLKYNTNADNRFTSEFFATGVEKLKSSVAAAHNTTGMKFTGKTLGVVEDKNNAQNKKRLTGTATVDIEANTATGKLTFAYDNWYTLSKNNVDFSDKDHGFETNDTANWDISGDSGDDKFKFTGKNITRANLKGAMYGVENDKATEMVGTYGLGIDNFDLKGAFGVKRKTTP